MRKSILYIAVLGLFMIQLGSCDLIDDPETIPAYIQIDTIKLQTSYETERSSSHKIVDAWVFANNQLIGAFELPMKAPVLLNGVQDIEVFAGISDNGIRSFPEVYPFYDRSITTKTLVAGETTIIEPVVNYIDEVEVELKNGDFETGNPFQNVDPNQISTLELSNIDPFEGDDCGRMLLTGGSPFIEVKSLTEFTLPNPNQSPMYIELNYKNDVPFEVGIIAYKNNVEFGKIYVVGMLESEEWNKIYINLRADVAFLEGDKYRIALKASKSANVTEDEEVLVDNIKLLYLKD
jgi:hypothetical protein